MADKQQIKAFMEADFLPERELNPDERTAAALEYLAYHIGQIDKQLTGLNATLREISWRLMQ